MKKDQKKVQPKEQVKEQRVADFPVQPFKDKTFARNFFKLMVRTRVLEERLIKMAKSGDGFFWIGGPGEEAFATALGLLVNKGEGPAFDMLHLHYRSNGVLVAMGQPTIDFIRQMKSVVNDPFSGGRNFVSHVARKDWNIMPVTSTIETQFVMAPGTGLAQRRLRSKGQDAGITVVVGGDAGTAEGDFASCLIWSSRPGAELPVLMIVTNNRFGISTPADTQHGEKHIADRGKAFGIKTAICEGNAPEKVWAGVRDAMDYVRETGKPFLLEVAISRCYGHSSSSGASWIDGEECPIETFEKKLLKQSWITAEEKEEWYEAARQDANAALEQVRKEEVPQAGTVLDHSFARGERGGIPGRDS